MILMSLLGIELMPPAMEAQILFFFFLFVVNFVIH